MNTEGFIGSFDPHRHIHPTLNVRISLVLLAKFGIRRLFADHRLELGRLSPNNWNQLGEPVGIAVRNIEHTGDILQHSLGGHAIESDDLRHLVLAVALGDVVDHLTTTFNAEVGIDIWHRFTFRIEKAFEQQAVAHRIDICNAKAIGDEGTCSRTTPRTDGNILFTCKSDVIPDHKEVSGKTHLLHDLELMSHALGVIIREIVSRLKLKPLTQTALSDFSEISDRGVAIGYGKPWHLITAQDVVRLYFFCNFHRVGDCLLNNIRFKVISEETAHFLFRLDVFRACVSQTFLVSDQLAGKNAKQSIMSFNILLG